MTRSRHRLQAVRCRLTLKRDVAEEVSKAVISAYEGAEASFSALRRATSGRERSTLITAGGLEGVDEAVIANHGVAAKVGSQSEPRFAV